MRGIKACALCFIKQRTKSHASQGYDLSIVRAPSGSRHPCEYSSTKRSAGAYAYAVCVGFTRHLFLV